MSDAVLVDVAGNTIEPGDWVVYPQMSGRSVQIVLGKLVSYNGKTAKIERIEGGRWQPGWRSTKYRDKRTGKGINIWSAGMAHWEKQPRTFYRNRQTGIEIEPEEFYRRRVNYHDWERKYERGVLKDYVEEYRPELPAVTIHNVSNIVKVTAAMFVPEREGEQ